MANNQKKNQAGATGAAGEAKTPTEHVLDLQQQGKSDAEIVTALTDQGLKPGQISEAFNQAKIKQAVTAKAPPTAPGAAPPEAALAPVVAPAEGLAPSILTTGKAPAEAAPAPAAAEEFAAPAPIATGELPAEEYYGYGAPATGAGAIDTEAIEEITESIISEKWEEAKTKISSMTEWKDYTENRLKSMEERNKRVEKALDSLQAALLGKVQRYSQDIKTLGTEMKSLQGAFSKVLSPLSSNIKALQKIAGRIKVKKEAKAKPAKKKHKKKK